MEKRTLGHLKIGQSAFVKSVSASDEPLRRRLLDMGIIPNTKIKIVKRAPMGDPVEIFLRGYCLTLRLEEIENIEIESIKNENSTNR